LGLILWARQPDSYARENLALKEKGKPASHCLLVRPRAKKPWPVVVYIHDIPGEMIADGDALRKVACAGFICVDANIRTLDAKMLKQNLEGLTGMLEARNLLNGQGCAWMASGITPDFFIQLAALRRELRPDLVVCMPDTDTPDIPFKSLSAVPPKLDFPVFVLTNADQADSSQQEALRNWLHKGNNYVEILGFQRTEDVPGTLPYWELAQRIGQILNSAGKVQAFGPLPRPEVHSISFFFWPAAGFFLLYVIVLSRRQMAHLWEVLSTQKMAPYFACLLGIALGCVLGNRIVKKYHSQLPTPVLKAEEILSFTDKWNLADAQGKEVREYLELADYCRRLVNWNINETQYQDYVLNPILKVGTKTGLEWRWILWSGFYPKIRKTNSPLEAASVLAGELRTEIEIQNQPRNDFNFTRIWRDRVASADEFKILHVAALRAVGICARINVQGMVEILQNTKWLPAPLPPEIVPE
jgi:hypothetical protein